MNNKLIRLAKLYTIASISNIAIASSSIHHFNNHFFNSKQIINHSSKHFQQFHQSIKNLNETQPQTDSNTQPTKLYPVEDITDKDVVRQMMERDVPFLSEIKNDEYVSQFDLEAGQIPVYTFDELYKGDERRFLKYSYRKLDSQFYNQKSLEELIFETLFEVRRITLRNLHELLLFRYGDKFTSKNHIKKELSKLVEKNHVETVKPHSKSKKPSFMYRVSFPRREKAMVLYQILNAYPTLTLEEAELERRSINKKAYDNEDEPDMDEDMGEEDIQMLRGEEEMEHQKEASPKN